MISVIYDSHSWEFGTGAEAHEAYVVTELGNLFPVETPNAGPIGSNAGLGALRSGVTQAMLGFLSGITEKETDFEYLTGTNSEGELHDYTSFFTIPGTVANSTSGYVAIYRVDDPHTSVSIPNFFSTYQYSNSSNTLSDISVSNAMPNFDDYIAVQSFGSSKKVSGIVSSSGYGFYVYGGTYVIKLHPGYAYKTPSNIWCSGTTCNMASIITSDSNIMGTTSDGLFLRQTTSISEEGTISLSGVTENDRYGPNEHDSSHRVLAYISLGNARVSSPGNVYSVPYFLSMDYTINQTCRPAYSLGTPPPLVSVPIEEIQKTFGKYGSAITNVINGVHFAQTQKYSTTFQYHSEWDRHGHNTSYKCQIPISATYNCQSSGHRSTCTLQTSTLNSNTVDLGRLYITPVKIFDAGIPVNEHIAYWADDTSTVPVGNTTNTLANPDYASVSGNNVYMIIGNDLGGSVDVEGYEVANAELRIRTNLPDMVYSIDGTGRDLPIVGVTDSSGEIRIENSNRFDGVHDLTLNLYHDTLVFRNLSGLTVIDHVANWNFNIPDSRHDNVVYVITKYVDLPIPLDNTEVTGIGIGLGNCDADKLALSYLDGTYNGGDNLLVPIIPGYDRVCYELGGNLMTLKYSDIRQNADVGFGESEGNSNDVNTPISGSTGTTANVALHITALESGRLEVVVEGIVRSESDMRYIKMYKGETNMPGDTAFNPDPITRRYGSHCEDTMGIPGWSAAGIANMEPLSDIPDPSSSVSATISVSKNGAVVLTKTVLTDVPTDLNTREINTSVPEIRKSYPNYFSLGLYTQNSIGYWCLPDRTDVDHVDLADGIESDQYMLCSSGTYSYFGAFNRWIRVPVCEIPDRASECGYEVTQRQQRSVFGETVTLDGIAIGDVIEVDITATYRVGLEEFTCNGQTTGNNFKRGTVTVDILNPSVQVQ